MFLFMAVALLGLSACNDDATENDALYTVQIKGTWYNQSGNDDNVISQTYKFGTDRFVWNNSYMDMDEMLMKTWSVEGAWNVQKGVLQMSYDLESFKATGYTDVEQRGFKTMLESENLMLSDMNRKGRPYGREISFNTVDGRTVLVLYGVNGYFERVGN